MKTGTLLLGGIVVGLSFTFYSFNIRSLPNELQSVFQIYRQHLIIKLLFTAVLIIFLVYVIYNLLQKDIFPTVTPRSPPSYCQRINKTDFQWQTSVYTHLKKEELYRSPEYREAKQRKGINEECWNWQSREQLRKQMGFPLSPMSSDEELMSETDS